MRNAFIGVKGMKFVGGVANSKCKRRRATKKPYSCWCYIGNYSVKARVSRCWSPEIKERVNKSKDEKKAQVQAKLQKGQAHGKANESKGDAAFLG